MWAQLLGTIVRATPSQCEVCRAWPAHSVCGACIERFAAVRPRCLHCAVAVPAGVAVCGRCLRGPSPLTRCIAAASYGYSWLGLVARFKFSGEAGWGSSFARLMLAAPGAAQLVADADLLLPMPLRDTPPQAQLAFGERQANVRQAFALEPARVHDVRGKRVLLVDDVMTTGASLFALAGELLEGGAAQVDALVFARTEE